MIDARDKGWIGANKHGYNHFTNVTIFFKDDKIIEVYRYGWTNLDKIKKEEEKSGKGLEGGDTCLLSIVRKCTVKASVHVPLKVKKNESPAPELMIKDGKE